MKCPCFTAVVAALLLSLTGLIRAQTTLITNTDGGWAYLNPIAAGGNGFNPVTQNANFESSWLLQSLGAYSGVAYAGPAFTTGATAPFSYGGVDGISGGTILATPNTGTRGAAYFLKVLDGGSQGYSSLSMTMLADDAAMIYLNGQLIGVKGALTAATADHWNTLATTAANELDYSSVTLIGSPVVQPGANLLAISLHQAATNSSDLGFRMALTGTAGIPLIYGASAASIGQNSATLSWSTAKASSAVLSWGLSPGSLTESASLSGPATSFSHVLTGLGTLTTYFYRIDASSAAEGLTGTATGSFTTLAGGTVIPITRGPYLQSSSTTRMTVRWRTGTAGPSLVRYGTALNSLNITVSIAGSRTEHEVLLTGLAANTRFYYQVETRIDANTAALSPVSADYSFQTSPVPGTAGSYRIWAIGDSGTADANARAVYQSFLNHTGSRGADVWLMLGDNAYNSGTDAEFQQAVFNTYPELLRKTPLWSCLGNHETMAGAPYAYFQLHTFPTGGECGGVASGTENYFSFDYGNIHFVNLDSMDHDTDALDAGMFAWLVQDLAANDKTWTVAFWHHPAYSKGSHNSDVDAESLNMRSKANRLLEEYGVDLVLSGHSHCYERSRLIDGHYGLSASFLSSNIKQSGNGSEIGGVNSAGAFVPGAANAGGAYEKILDATNAGAVYSVVGSSGKLGAWTGGSTAVVNPIPHAAHLVSLRVYGSMVIDVTAGELHAWFLDTSGNVRDDFSIRKDVTPAPLPPAVVTLAATPAGDTTATLNGSVTGHGTATVTFEYGTADGSYDETVTATPSPVSGDSATAVSAALSGLLPHTTYYFRVRATSAVGTSNGAGLSFSTSNHPPVAGDDDAGVLAGQLKFIAVLTNDTDEDGDSLTLTGIGPAEQGFATIYGGGIFYSAPDGYSGPDSFLYEVSDGFGGIAYGMVTVNVTRPLISIQPSVGPVDPASVNFGAVLAAGGIAVLTFTVSNPGTADLTLGTITLDGTEFAEFYLNTTGTLTTLTPGASTTFTVAFTPDELGPRNAALHIPSNVAGKTPFDIALTGAGRENAPPVAANATYTRAAGTSLKIDIASLLASSTTDPDGDPRTLQSIGVSAQGATVSLAGPWMLYSPANNNNDTFSYTVNDGQGHAATGNLSVNIVPLAGRTGALTLNGLGQPVVGFAGIPGYRYAIERAANTGGPWTTVHTLNAPVTGVFSFTDTSPLAGGSGFYRMRFLPAP